MIFDVMKKRLRSFSYAFKGFADVLRTQPNMRIHMLAMAAVACLGAFFRISALEWCIIALVVGLVLIAEILNTALEYLGDAVSPDFHPLVGKAKDAAAAAVLLSAFVAIIVGCLVFIPHTIRLLNQ